MSLICIVSVDVQQPYLGRLISKNAYSRHMLNGVNEVKVQTRFSSLQVRLINPPHVLNISDLIGRRFQCHASLNTARLDSVEVRCSLL